MSSPTSLSNMYSSLHLSGWYFLASALCFLYVALLSLSPQQLRIVNASLLVIFHHTEYSLPGVTLCLSSPYSDDDMFLDRVLEFWLEFGASSSVLVLLSLKSPYRICILSFTIFVHTFLFCAHPTQSFKSPLRSTSLIRSLRLSTNKSLSVLNGRLLLRLPTHITINSLFGYLVYSIHTILPMNSNCLLLHTSSILDISPNLLLISSFVISSSYTCFIDILSIFLMALFWKTSHLLMFSLLPL